jgi:hypothetical protein
VQCPAILLKNATVGYTQGLNFQSQAMIKCDIGKPLGSEIPFSFLSATLLKYLS